MFDQPISLVPSPDHASWFVAERRGRVWRLDAANELGEPELVLDISDRVNASTAAIGLLAIAVHPTNGALFASYTGFGGTLAASRLGRFPPRGEGHTFDASREQILLELDQISDYHVNADLRFGPDGYLYVGFGDGGPQGDPLRRAQDPFSLKGKILRLDVSSAAPYRIPSDNPFARGGGRPEVWALGLRNPWRLGFDRETGELWAGDVGQDHVEEIDRIVSGGNYGWNVREGNRCVSAACSTQNLIEPVLAIAHPLVSSITFGVAYRGSALPSLRGHLIYGDYASGTLWEVDPVERTPRIIDNAGHAVVSFAEDADGEPLLVDLRGTLWRIVPGDNGPADMPARLSATGCFDKAGVPVPALIPYAINVPFWSDAASKRRWFAIPEGTKIGIGADGHLQFPVGSVVAKEFTLDNRRVETRLFVRHDDGEWAGYSYRWDAAQTDAMLVPSAAMGTTSTGPQSWYYPHRGECMRCHNAGAGFTLGLELRQLRQTVDVGGQPMDQVIAFDRIGLFASPIPDTEPLPSPAAAVEQRARAWLHVNCAYCHRPGGTGQGNMDLRITTPLAATGLCAPPQGGTFGLASDRLLAPGNPRSSMLSRRIHSKTFIRMPPIGTVSVDTEGAAVVDQWIREVRCE